MEIKNSYLRRSPVRIRIWNDVKAEIAISDVKGNYVDSKASSALIQDISPTGARLLTHLRFPVNKDYHIRIMITIGEWEFNLTGQIVWRRKDENLYMYGCEFVPDRHIRQALAVALKEKLRLMNPERQRIHLMYQQVLDAMLRPSSSMDASL
ncbi:PilZ domain-containing protein [Paenibacillus sp. MWE-103]|uniref:PilZ domain-containing protein n=1 Tax=Paenibacillus artemisiicola TaxID=1172618 RepID=A0ABS3WI63_9BACL|nr:PilZ domain-containing protein [Paenibacillus artemisiicola]MBO7747791.1 PilZ domain-containing protein [Paenibacillus artemisiicola]